MGVFLVVPALGAAVPQTRIYLTGAYPLNLNMSLMGESPEVLIPGEKMPLGSFKGSMAGEFGLVPGIELPAELELALVFQFFNAGGLINQYTTSVPPIKMSFYSMGMGIRLDRPFWVGGSYGVAPLFALTAHYQNFHRSDGVGGAELVTYAIAPEIGINQLFRFGQEGFRLVLGTTAGMFIYGGQSLTYAKVSFGFEYAYQ